MYYIATVMYPSLKKEKKKKNIRWGSIISVKRCSNHGDFLKKKKKKEL